MRHREPTAGFYNSTCISVITLKSYFKKLFYLDFMEKYKNYKVLGNKPYIFNVKIWQN